MRILCLPRSAASRSRRFRCPLCLNKNCCRTRCQLFRPSDWTTANSNYMIVDNFIDEASAAPDPIKQFHRWFDHARAAEIPLAESMTLATATAEGRPSARIVLLKHADENGFVFYTNYRSRKARELDANPFAALIFYWQKLDYQIRVEGSVTRVSAAESDAYFATRPRDSQLGAHASPQSDAVADRSFLERG